MAEITRRRARRSARRLERQRRAAIAVQGARTRGPGAGPPEPPPPDDLDGGAGVREPRRPQPGAPVAAMELEPERPQYLDLVG